MENVVHPSTKAEPDRVFGFDPVLARQAVGSVDEVFADLGRGEPAVAAVLRSLKDALRTGHGAWEATEALVSQAAGVPYPSLSDYMDRSWLREKRNGMVYAARVHKVKRSDHDRALHDHPWMNCSIVLSNGYWEVTQGVFQACIEKHFYGRWAGPVTLSGPLDDLMASVLALNDLIKAEPAFRLLPEQVEELAAMGVHWRAPMAVVRRSADSLHRLIVPLGMEAWSLFVMRPKIREWGFLGLDGWEHNVAYVDKLGKDA